ncbi:hypothetical protein TSH58p_03680 [Azospirillum sp. TSH58]|uniref:hypothetical protein n=1 Tax=Azospirillum sp. TSH58 TaxID=664962 RepID=UPI000D60227B|nr:hypothetical protein [Azospirillum sp. TSH58]AWJ82697.1 hypothetical protein TSH58p_03680 [Azospirillum sp. TSH58]PWC69502.1 hypothetical protein TSH58_15335 [Azospirillum sp. TSH58]
MSILQFYTDRGAPRPVHTEIRVERLTLRAAADWQQDIAAECRRRRTLSADLFDWLERRGLFDRCTVLAAMEAETPLLFRRIGVPTVKVLGMGWSRSMIGQPEAADPHADYAHRIGLEYAEAIGAGEALFNRIAVAGVGRPFVYTQALFGWEDRGRRAVLSAIDVQTLH